MKDYDRKEVIGFTCVTAVAELLNLQNTTNRNDWVPEGEFSFPGEGLVWKLFTLIDGRKVAISQTMLSSKTTYTINEDNETGGKVMVYRGHNIAFRWSQEREWIINKHVSFTKMITNVVDVYEDENKIGSVNFAPRWSDITGSPFMEAVIEDGSIVGVTWDEFQTENQIVVTDGPHKGKNKYFSNGRFIKNTYVIIRDVDALKMIDVAEGTWTSLGVHQDDNTFIEYVLYTSPERDHYAVHLGLTKDTSEGET